VEEDIVIYPFVKCPAMVRVVGAGLAILIMISGCATSKDISSLDVSDSTIARLGPKPKDDMTLISNQEMTSFYLVSDDQKILIGKGKIVPVKVDPKARYEIVAHPVGYTPMSLFTTVPPPYELRFTFHLSDRDGSVPDTSAVLPELTTEGLKIYDAPGSDTLALIPTQSSETGGVDSAVGDRLNHLFSESKRFSIVERDRIQDAITELNFQQSDLVDQNNALRMGKLLGASYILISDVSRPGAGKKQVFAKLVYVKTGKQMTTAIAECKGDSVPIQTLIQVVNKINSGIEGGGEGSHEPAAEHAAKTLP
jgi:hypothetical protein